MFYVYEHWRPDKNVCFYVGKGHGPRAYVLKRGKNHRYNNTVSKVVAAGFAVEVRIIAKGMEEAAAFALEIERIAFWRGQGHHLTNQTAGGRRL